MRSFQRVCGSVALLVSVAMFGLSTGCAVEAYEEDTETETEQTEVARSAAVISYAQHTWNQGDASPRNLYTFDNYWCALTGVSGKFRGVGEEVRLDVAAGSPRMWRINGKSNQTGVSGSVTCYARSSFTGVGTSSIVSPEFEHHQTSPEACGWLGIGDCVWGPPSPSLKSVWQGDSVTMLTGMSGDFRSENEFIEIRQARTGTAATILAAENYIRHDETSRLYAHSFFVGTPGAGRAARFIGNGGVRGTAGVADEFAAGGINGTQRVRMAARNEAMCYLTHLSGSFSSASVGAKIEADSQGYWTLAVTGISSQRVFARARCMLLDQRTAPVNTFEPALEAL